MDNVNDNNKSKKEVEVLNISVGDIVDYILKTILILGILGVHIMHNMS